MPNDAKFGLLAGVIGVVVVAVMSANRPPAPQPMVDPSGSPSASVKPEQEAKPAAPIAHSPEPATSPVLRTKKEFDGTSTSRVKNDDIDP